MVFRSSVITIEINLTRVKLTEATGKRLFEVYLYIVSFLQ